MLWWEGRGEGAPASGKGRDRASAARLTEYMTVEIESYEKRKALGIIENPECEPRSQILEFISDEPNKKVMGKMSNEKKGQNRREGDLSKHSEVFSEKAGNTRRWNRWWTLATITAAGTFVSLILELLGAFGELGIIIGLGGLTLTLLFGMQGVVSSLDYRRSFEVLAKNQAETHSILRDIRDSLEK